MKAPVYDRYGAPAVLRVEEVPVPSLGRITGRRVGMLVVKQGPTYFEPLAEDCLAGDVTVHIARTFGLDEVPEALAHVGEGRALGKAVVALG